MKRMSAFQVSPKEINILSFIAASQDSIILMNKPITTTGIVNTSEVQKNRLHCRSSLSLDSCCARCCDSKLSLISSQTLIPSSSKISVIMFEIFRIPSRVGSNMMVQGVTRPVGFGGASSTRERFMLVEDIVRRREERASRWTAPGTYRRAMLVSSVLGPIVTLTIPSRWMSTRICFSASPDNEPSTISLAAEQFPRLTSGLTFASNPISSISSTRTAGLSSLDR
mmetsp:Transcript_34770/g.56081  ORF Transcript_34770/g.56081 Transcript_34770/m.56081 type:complete len:225 (+) Transcript_34770:2196-2870(+)